jgi:tetratricopeptide (TPR) repeat protein
MILICGLILCKASAFAITAEASTEEVKAIVIKALADMDNASYEAAMVKLDKAIEAAPSITELYFLRWLCHLKQKKYYESEQDLFKSTPTGQQWGYYYYAMGVSDFFDDVSTSYRRYEDVVQYETNALNTDPSLTDAYTYRAYAYYKLKKYGDAWNDVKKMRELGIPVNPDFLEMLNADSGGEPKMFFFF